MPYCPNCGCEYKPGHDTCADCGSTLVADDPNAPDVRARPPVSAVTMIELTVAALVAPWLAYLLLLAADQLLPNPAKASPGLLVVLALMLCAIAPVVLAVAYGSRRWKAVGSAQMLIGWAFGNLLQILLCLSLAATGIARQAHGLLLRLPAAAVCSAVVLAFGWSGRLVLPPAAGPIETKPAARFLPNWVTAETSAIAFAAPWAPSLPEPYPLPALCVVVLVYGLWRGARLTSAHALAGWAIGTVLHVILSAVLVRTGVYGDKLLIGGAPFFAMLSAAVLLVAWIVSRLRRKP